MNVAISPEQRAKLLYDSQMLLTRTMSLEEISAANLHRIDALFENLGEISGSCASIKESYASARESNEKLSNIRFDKDIFYREIRNLSFKIDNIFSKTEHLDSIAREMTDDLDDFLRRTRFLEIIEITRSMISESQNVEARLKVQENSFRKTDFQKLHSDMTRLLESIHSYEEKIKQLNLEFISCQKNLSAISKRFAMLVQKKNFFEQNSSLMSRYLLVSGKMNTLSRKINGIKSIPSPNFLFIGQSLHNYVATMIEKGFRSDYIVDYLAKRGVDRALVKMVVENVNLSAGAVCDINAKTQKNSKLFKS